MAHKHGQSTSEPWVSFPGGELEGIRPRALCSACRDRLRHEASVRAAGAPASRRPTLCFQCYRAGLDRDRALRRAGELNAASVARFQDALPFEPVDRPRLARLKAERAVVRATLGTGAGRFVDRRRQAQIAARHALQAIAAGLEAREAASAERERALAAAIHAAELQLPDAWLPFVVAR